MPSIVERVLSRFRPSRRSAANLNGSTMRAALARCRARGHPVASVIDVGASDGRWMRLAHEFFPDARGLLIEAQRVHEPALLEFCALNSQFEVALVAAGERDGMIYFDASDPFGGVASELPRGPEYVPAPLRSIDSLIDERQLAPPFLFKLDTHGYEVPIFEGAADVLTQTELLVVEAYNFKLIADDPRCLRFHELCAYLEQRGLRCIDLCDVSRRPHDGCLWQCDLIFAPQRRPEFSN